MGAGMRGEGMRVGTTPTDISMYGMKRDQLQLLPYDPAWEDDFLGEKNEYSDIGGRFSLIEHVGSTRYDDPPKPILIAILCERKKLEHWPGHDQLGYDTRQFAKKRAAYYAIRDKKTLLCR